MELKKHVPGFASTLFEGYRWTTEAVAGLTLVSLRNVLERALILHREVLRPSELLAPAVDGATARAVTPAGDDEELTMDQLEQRQIERAHARHQGNLTAIARARHLALHRQAAGEGARAGPGQMSQEKPL